MSESQKHKSFVAEPVRDKLVTKLAGIGPALGEKLKAKGFVYARQLVGKYLELNKDEEKFKNWLHQTCSANSEQQRDCHKCVKEWCDQHFD